MSDNLCVIFTTECSDVKRAAPLQVSRAQYLACAKLRKEVCYAFADVELGDGTALPENGVPEALVREAVSMPEAQHFEPSFDSVAKPQDASAKVAEDVVDAEDETTMAEAEAAEGEAPELQSRDEGKTPDQQHLLGLDEAHADDPLAQIVFLQKGLQVLNSESQQILARQRRYHAAVEKNDKDLVGMVGGAQQCRQRFVDIQELYRKIRKLEYVDVVPKQDGWRRQ